MHQLNNSTLEELAKLKSVSLVQIDEKEQSMNESEQCRAIVDFCRINKQNFIDPSFPQINNSIGPLSMKDLNIIWLRPEQIVTQQCCCMSPEINFTIFDKKHGPSDIKQGYLGNCWFLSALAVVSERPDILEKLFITKQYNHFGIYEMRLCVDGLWQNIIVDDYFPCYKRNRKMVFAKDKNKQLYVSLLEKALAKVHSNYANLSEGRTSEGLSTLTGAPTQSIDLEYIMELKEENRNTELELVWTQLLSARESRFIICCSCGVGNREISEKEYQKVGLVSQHAYSIMDIKQTSQGYRVIHLRNPLGSDVWKGEFSTKWPGWTPQLLHELHSEANSQPGNFWMPFKKFVHYFDTVNIAQIHTNWTAKRYSLDIGWAEGKCKIVRFTITEPTQLCVTLHQRNARTTAMEVDILVLIHRRDPTKELFPGELICRSARRIRPLVQTDDKFFQPGEYLICAHSFSKFGDKLIPGAIVIHASKKIYSEIVPVNLNIFQASICSLMLKDGILQQTNDGFTARYLTNEFAGLAIMIDNGNKDKYIQVRSDCQASTNVLSTRGGSLLAVDSIPPLHRQIITVLTRSEPTQAFEVRHRLIQRPTSFPQLRDYARYTPSMNYDKLRNYPPIIGPAIGALHGPSPLFS